MKVSIDKQNNARNVNFKGYDTEKSKIGGFQYTFNCPYDTNKYNGYLELCAVSADENKNYKIIKGLVNKNIDLTNVPDNKKLEIGMALPLQSGKTTINLSADYGLSEKDSFGYHFKMVPKNGGEPFYLIDSGDVMDLTNTGKKMAHDLYNLVVPGSEGSDVGSAILLIPDSYNAMYCYDKDGKVVPNLQYLEAAKATKHFSNKMGGSLAGVEHDLDAGKFDNYTKIISTPIFTDDSLTPHSYWNINCMQMAHSLGNINNYQNLQKKLFAKGINWVSDGAFVNEGLQGVHFKHVLKWGEKSPYFNWFRAQGLKDKPLSLGVFPKNNSIVGMKTVNAPYLLETASDGTVNNVKKNKKYDKNKPTYIQVFDKRLVSENEAKDGSPLIKSYSKLDTGNTFDIVTHHDTLPPYAFEIDPEILTRNMETVKEYNSKVKKEARLEKDSYQVTRMLSKSEYWVLDEKNEGGFETWDANVDIAKINYVYSKENVKDLHNIMDSDDRDEYNQSITHNNFMAQDYALTSAQYWTRKTNRILNLHVAQNLKNVDETNPQKIMQQIDDNVVKKQVFPAKLKEAIDENIVDNILEDVYDLKPQSKEEYKNVIISGMMDLPLDSIELGDNIISVLASPFMTKRATHEDDLGVSRFDIQRLYDNNHLDDEFKKNYMATNELYEKEMYNFASGILDQLNKKLPKNLQLNDGLNTSEYGKYVLPYLTSEIAKFAVIKGLFPDAEAMIDKENGGMIYDYDNLKQTSLQQLGIVANSPEEEAELLIKHLKGSKFLKKGIPAISDKDKELLVESLYKMIEGTNTTSFKLAEVIVDRTKSGLDWRIDATKDIADVESLRKKETDFEDTWNNVINFWSKFAKFVYKENSSSYLVAEVTNEGELYGAAGMHSPKFKNYNDIVMKFLRETGITSIANYGHFFTDIPCLYGKRTETGDDWGITQYDKIHNIMKGFLQSGPLPSLVSSYTFADNHDKPRVLHGMAMDMELFYADLTAKTDKYMVNTPVFKHKETAYKVLHGKFIPTDSVEDYKIHNFDFTRIDSKAIAMGDAMGTAMGIALDNMANGSFKSIDANQQNKAFIALAAAVSDLAKGSYNGQNFQAEAFGVRPFDTVIEMVVNQAVKQHGLKFSDNQEKNEELIKTLKKTMFWAALEPAISKVVAIMKTLVALPGNPTLFAGDDIGSTGYEQLTKNIYLSNRSTVHHEWLEEDSPEKQFDFLKESKAEFDRIMATRKRPELHALNDGAPFNLRPIQCVDSPAKVNALLRQSTDGSMAISLFNMSGANHDFRQKNDPKAYPVKMKSIELDSDGRFIGLKGGLTPGIEFIDSQNSGEIYEVRNDANTDHYYIVRKDGGDIEMNDNTKILFYVSPEYHEKSKRIYALREAIAEQNKNKKTDIAETGTYMKILNMKAQKEKAPSFTGKKSVSRQLYNPQYNFRTAGAYENRLTHEAGSKLSLISR